MGREEDLAALKELLESRQTSLATLVAPGGTGKTSLAAALGAQLLTTFPAGVFIIDLSALNDPALVMPALAQVLSLKETPGRTLQQSLAAHLSSKEMLVRETEVCLDRPGALGEQGHRGRVGHFVEVVVF